MIFYDIASEFANASLWGQLGFSSTVVTLLGGIVALAAWVSRRRVMGDLALAQMRAKNLEEQVLVEKKHLESCNARLSSVVDRLHVESFQELLSICGQVADYNTSNVGGNLIKKVIEVDAGFNSRINTLREVSLRLSLLWLSQVSGDVPIAASKAEYFAKIAQALIDDDEARYQLDLVREFRATAALDLGTYNPASPEWHSFSLLPGNVDIKSLTDLLENLNLRMLKATHSTEEHYALRLAARLSFLTQFINPPWHWVALNLGVNISGVYARFDQFDAIMQNADRFLALMKQSKDKNYSDESLYYLVIASHRAQALLGKGLTREAEVDAKEILPRIQKLVGIKHPLYKGTHSISNGSYSHRNSSWDTQVVQRPT